MMFDTITQVVKTDMLILSLGERMFLRNGQEWAEMKNSMKILAKLILVAN